VKNYFENKKDEFETLIFKINEIENSRTTIENKHKSEINQFNKQITSLDEQFQLLNSNGKSINSSIRVLKNKLNIIKGEAKTVSKKFSELKKEFESLEGVSKEKDYEISLLLGQINSLKNLANINDEIMPEDEIDLYIDKLKNNQNMQKRQSEKSNMSYKKLSRNEPNKATDKNVINSYDYKKSIKKFKTINTGEKRKGYDFIDDVIDSGNKDKKTMI
jgi:chromosome segregation ATPase